MKDILKPHLINYSMTFSPCQNFIAISNNFNSIKILNLNDHSEGIINCSSNPSANIYNISNCGSLLLCTSDCYIFAWKWNDIESDIINHCKNLSSLWQVALPINSDFLGCLQIISMYVNESEKIIYVGSSDSNIHLFRLDENGRPEYLSCYKGNNGNSVLSLTTGKGYSLISGYSDGTIRFWDERQEKECIKIETQKCAEVSRPQLGCSINVVATDRESSDWVLCGGQAQLALWNVRAQRVGVVMKTENKSVDDSWIPFKAILRDEAVIAGGNSSRLYLWDLSGQLNSEIGLAGCKNVYDLLHREKSELNIGDYNDFFLCGWGPFVELYSDIGYRKKIFNL